MDDSGQCRCSKVRFSAVGDPLIVQYCHCYKCREIAALSSGEAAQRGYALTAAYLTANFHIVTGKDQLTSITKNKSTLWLCSGCQTLIYGIALDPEQRGGIGVNLDCFQFGDKLPTAFQPVRHIWYADRVADIDDGLPKFKDAPKEQFGSGERLAWKEMARNAELA